MNRSSSQTNTIRWALEINLWLWVVLLVYVVGVRQVWDRYPLMAAGGLFIAATAQFIYQRLRRRRH